MRTFYFLLAVALVFMPVGCGAIYAAVGGCSLIVGQPEGYIPPAADSPAADPTPVPPTATAPVTQTLQRNAEGYVGPTTAEVSALVGVDLVRVGTEPSAWTWRGKPSTATITCPEGFSCTLDAVDDITVVVGGVNQEVLVYAGTFRWLEAYPQGICGIFDSEQEFALKEGYQVRYQEASGYEAVCP